MYRAVDIAAWLIKRDNKEEHRKNDEHIGLLKLMKLLYYCQGIFLAIDDEELFSEEIVAWDFGPVVVDVYEKFRGIEPREVYKHVDILDDVKIDEDTEELLEQTYNIFGKNYTARELVDKTHREAPWLKATNYGEYLKGAIIERQDIQDYFKKYYVKAA